MTKIYFFFLCFITFANAQDYKKDTIELHETILYDKSKFRLKRVGPETKSKSICLQFSTIKDSVKWNKPIIESFIQVNAPKKDFIVKAINFNFSYPPKEESFKLNLKLYKSSKNTPVDTVFFEKNNIEISPSDIVNQSYKLDLTDDNISYNDEFYISVLMTKRLVDEFVCLSGVILSNGFTRNLTTNGGFEKNPLGAKPSVNADLLIKR